MISVIGRSGAQQQIYNGAESMCRNSPDKVQTSTWRNESCVEINACKPQWTEGKLQRQVGQNFSTTMWDTNKVTQDYLVIAAKVASTNYFAFHMTLSAFVVLC